MALFAFQDVEHYYGEPALAPGTRVRFVLSKLLAIRGDKWPGDPELVARDGLVVHEVATDVIIWPSSLWRVEDVERPVRLAPGNRWVRCLAFTVVEQVPTWLVAGPRGDAVERIIGIARTLTTNQVEALAALPNEGVEALKRAVWHRWLRDHRSGSPVGCGLSTLHDAVTEAARREGPHLFGWDDEDENEVLTDPAWLRASDAAYAAALAFGASELLAPEEGEVLALRWTTVFGSPESRDRRHLR